MFMYAFVLMLLSALSSAICRSTAVELCNRCGNGHDRFTFSEVCYILSEIGFILTSCFCSQMSAPVEITDPDLLNIAKVDLAMAQRLQLTINNNLRAAQEAMAVANTAPLTIHGLSSVVADVVSSYATTPMGWTSDNARRAVTARRRLGISEASDDVAFCCTCYAGKPCSSLLD
jgi:hypothetical protein